MTLSEFSSVNTGASRAGIHGIADWLAAVRSAVAENCASERMLVEGLEVELKAVDHSTIRWVLQFLQPLMLPAPPGVQRKYTVTYLHSDELVLAGIRNLGDIDIVSYRRHGQNHHVRRASV